MLEAANEMLFASRPRPARLLTLNIGAERVLRASEATKRDELWLGTAFDSYGEDHDIYLRLSHPQPVVAELVCAVIGRALGLPIPEPFIVAIGRGVLPGSHLIDHEAPATFTFASADIGGDTFAQLLSGDSESALQMLLEWQHLVPVATFDEWLANADRNLGNIIYAAQSLWLIDHAEAFCGSSRALYALAEMTTEAFTNKICMLLETCSPALHQKQLDDAQAWLNDPVRTLNLSEAFACADIARWLSAGEQTELLDFVTSRLAFTHTLLCTRLGHPQLSLLKEGET